MNILEVPSPIMKTLEVDMSNLAAISNLHSPRDTIGLDGSAFMTALVNTEPSSKNKLVRAAPIEKSMDEISMITPSVVLPGQLSPMKRNLTLNPYGMNHSDSQKSIMKEVRHRKVGLKQHDVSQSLVLPSIIQRGSSMVLNKKRSIHEVNFQEQQSTKPIVEIEPDLHNIL